MNYLENVKLEFFKFIISIIAHRCGRFSVITEVSGNLAILTQLHTAFSSASREKTRIRFRLFADWILWERIKWNFKK